MPTGGSGAGAAPEAPAASDSGLPAGWEEVRTDDGEAYYYNAATGETSWEKPTA
jgi:hypothetical protein